MYPTKLKPQLINFRGKRMQNTPSSLSGYPANAWYRYTDTTCNYGCQVAEYIWWGFCSYSGTMFFNFNPTQGNVCHVTISSGSN